MRIAHTEAVCLFREVTGVEQALVQNIVAMVKEAYLTDIRNRTTTSINNTVADVLTHLQNNYDQLIPHEILQREDIVKKTTYHPQYPIANVLSTVKQLLEFFNITETFYTQLQALNISYVIIHRIGKFGLANREWNHMAAVQKTKG